MDAAVSMGVSMDDPNHDEACSNCGLTRGGLYRDGRMGCAVCYETFETEVLHALWRIHGGVEHIGKA